MKRMIGGRAAREDEGEGEGAPCGDLPKGERVANDYQLTAVTVYIYSSRMNLEIWNEEHTIDRASISPQLALLDCGLSLET